MRHGMHNPLPTLVWCWLLLKLNYPYFSTCLLSPMNPWDSWTQGSWVTAFWMPIKPLLWNVVSSYNMFIKWMNKWMNRKCPLSYSHDQAFHEFGECLWVKGGNCCLNQCFRWRYSLLPGTSPPLVHFLLHVCASLRCRDKDKCGFVE